MPARFAEREAPTHGSKGDDRPACTLPLAGARVTVALRGILHCVDGSTSGRTVVRFRSCQSPVHCALRALLRRRRLRTVVLSVLCPVRWTPYTSGRLALARPAGLEPATSGLESKFGGLATDRNELQVNETVRVGMSGRVQRVARRAAIHAQLVTTSVTGGRGKWDGFNGRK
jgi:hypothetical protein